MVAMSIPESDKPSGMVTTNGTPRTQKLLQPTDFYGTVELLPPRPEPTEAHTAKAISIAAVRRAVRREKRAALAKRNDGMAIISMVLPHVILRGEKLTPQTFQKGSK